MTQPSNDLQLIQTDISLGYQLKPELQEKIDRIKTETAQLQQLTSSYKENPDLFMETNDEETIQAILVASKDNQKLESEFKTAVTAFKRYIKAETDKVLTSFNQILDDSGFPEYQKELAVLSQIKTDLNFRRANTRWAELKETFDATFDRYPDIRDRHPQLADFDRFRLANPKLVSGAKSSKVKKKDHTLVRETIHNYSIALESYDNNPWGLEPQYLLRLEQAWLQNPTAGAMMELASQALQTQQRDQENKRLEQERIAQEAERARIAKEAEEKRIAELKEQQRLAQIRNDAMRAELLAKQEAEAKIQLEKAAAKEKAFKEALDKFAASYLQPTIREKYPLYIEDLFARLDATGTTIHANDQQKAIEIWNVATKMRDSSSVIAKEIKGDPTRFLEIIRMLLDI